MKGLSPSLTRLRPSDLSRLKPHLPQELQAVLDREERETGLTGRNVFLNYCRTRGINAVEVYAPHKLEAFVITVSFR